MNTGWCVRVCLCVHVRVCIYVCAGDSCLGGGAAADELLRELSLHGHAPCAHYPLREGVYLHGEWASIFPWWSGVSG